MRSVTGAARAKRGKPASVLVAAAPRSKARLSVAVIFACFRSLIYLRQAHTIEAVMTEVLPPTCQLDAESCALELCSTLPIAIKGTCPIAAQGLKIDADL